MKKLLSDYQDLLTVNEACEVLRTERRTIYRHIREEKLPARKMAGKYLIPKAGIAMFIDEILSEPCYNNSCDGSDALQ